GCRLDHCALSGNWARVMGGGAFACTLSSCTVTTNWTPFSGGGVQECTLSNCVLSGNVAQLGGGAFGGTLNNCTVIGNSAVDLGEEWPGGGGAYFSTLNNCILYYNTGPAANYDAYQLNYCCTTPQPDAGFGDITNEPAFMDLANGNFRLQSNSPCINAGNNAYVVGT